MTNYLLCWGLCFALAGFSASAAFGQKKAAIKPTEKTVTPQDTAPAIIRPAEEMPAAPRTPDGLTTFKIVEQMPQAEYDYKQFLATHLVYPPLAKDSGISGVVYIKFQVGSDGLIRDAKVSKGIGYGCDEEAVRVVSRMPPWQPARQEGKPIPVRVNLPVRFTLHK